MSAFTKKVTYEFEVNGYQLSTEGTSMFPNRGLYCMEIEETEKNGQEDCHMSGVIVRASPDDPWRWDDVEADGSSFDTYGDTGLSDAILEFMNSHPLLD